MNILYDVAAMLVLAAGLVLLVLLALRLTAPAAVHRAEPEQARRPRLQAAAGAAVFLLALFGVTAVQTAFGAPVGVRHAPPAEVADAGECDRPVAGLGIVVRCAPEVWDPTVPFEYDLDDRGVVGGAAVEPGAEVAEYRLTGRLSPLMLMRPESQWRDTADESKPDLLWLSVLPFAGLLAYTVLRRGRSA
ncbi:hypothetical protein [Glycomyces sp. NPDC047010]|uniref:hypothetical protein n=1 Tax=Glycomyces sp. NPDC047010 TaxID=3155023 RepID=UPI0033FA3D7D